MTGKWGAIQLNLHPPHFYSGKTKDYTGYEAMENGTLREGWKLREGTIFMDITNASDKNVYDWDNKIVLALSVTDLGKMLHSFYTGEECNILHDPNAKSASQGKIKKNLRLSSPKGTSQGSMIRVSQTGVGQTKSYQVPLSGDELIVMKELLTAAIPQMLKWN
jgi:hypothetical protein